MVVGTGKVRLNGGPPSQTFTSTDVKAVVAVIVVPAIVATGSGGGGINTPSVEATGLVVLGADGKSVDENKEDVNGETKGFRYKDVVTGEIAGIVGGRNVGTGKGLKKDGKNWGINCAWDGAL